MEILNRNDSDLEKQHGRKIEQRLFSQPPFEVRPFEDHDNISTSPSSGSRSRFDDEVVRHLLPASRQTKTHDIAAWKRNVGACLAHELDLHRLDDIHEYLWLAGRPMPPRALHRQLLLGRQLLVTEQMDMHIVWSFGKIYLKPLPRFLLEPEIWQRYLVCNSDKDGQNHVRQQLYKRAVGFLFSYTALIQHESDFIIAKEKHLLPAQIEWNAWIALVDELDTENIYQKIDRRFYFGELRLARLNNLYITTHFKVYMSRWNQYSVFFRDNLTWLASSTVYIAIVLTAMQVGLATEVGNTKLLQSASYGFMVFSITGPLGVAALMLLCGCYMFVINFAATVRFKRERFDRIENGPRRDENGL